MERAPRAHASRGDAVQLTGFKRRCLVVRGVDARRHGRLRGYEVQDVASDKGHGAVALNE
jgi:hypothetical protein